MFLNYNNLWKTLIDKGMKKGELCKQTGISSSTLSKMNRNEPVSLALVAGLGEACRLAETEYEQNIAAYKEKKDAVLELIEKSGIKYEINGNQDYCMPNTINLSITGVESEALMLSSKQFCGISNGSACTSHEYSPSYVLTAMGLDADRISSAIRISWGAHTDKDELINELSELIAVAKSLVF